MEAAAGTLVDAENQPHLAAVREWPPTRANWPAAIGGSALRNGN